jgi:hypothetical protein
MKNNYLIVIVVIAIVGYFYFSKPRTKKRIDLKTEFQQNLQRIKRLYPNVNPADIEKVYRLETAHFRSGQYKGTWAPGMEKFGDKFPYGWNTINNQVWKKYPAAKPTGKFWTGTEGGTGIQKTFLVFPDLMAAMVTLAGFIDYYGIPQAWYSKKPEARERYKKSLDKINARWTDEIF